MEHKLSPGGQVVSYDQARAVLFSLGCGARRDGDYLVVLAERTTTTLYVGKVEDEKPLGRLYIDEGHYSSAQELGGTVASMSTPWREYVDFGDLAYVVLRKLDPEKAKECHSGDALGRGRRQRHRMGMIHERLVALGYWEASEKKAAS